MLSLREKSETKIYTNLDYDLFAKKDFITDF